MSKHSLSGKKVAILATDGFEQSELLEPKQALEKVGATLHVISVKPGEIKAWDKKDWGKKVKVDKVVTEANANDYDALVLPGGVMNPDVLRQDQHAVEFVKEFFTQGKTVASICHGPWTLIDAGVVRGKRMTSWPSLKTDLRNAGAEWVDEEVVIDNGLITSRRPGDLKAFGAKIVEQLSNGRELKAAS